MAIPHLLLLRSSINRFSRRRCNIIIDSFHQPIFLCHFTGEFIHQFHSLNAHCYHFPDQAHNILLVIQVVGVAHNTAMLILADLILIDYPIQRRAIAELVLEALLWYPFKCEAFIYNHCCLIWSKLHLLHAAAKSYILVINPFEWIFLHLLIMQVHVHQLPTNVHASQERLFVMQQGNMWQFTLQIFGIVFAILWMVLHGINVVEGIPLSHYTTLLRFELRKCPIGNVLPAVAVCFGIGIIRETLCSTTGT